MQQAGQDRTENSSVIENNLNVSEKMQFLHSINEIISSIKYRETNITVETLTTVLKVLNTISVLTFKVPTGVSCIVEPPKYQSR